MILFKVFKKIKKHRDAVSLLIIIFSVCAFFYPFLIYGKLPIPLDNIVGLYHPYRDFYANHYPNGIPYKNYLLTDPVRQQYIWKNFSVGSLSKGNLPIWNPYEMSGKPMLANFQGGVFYPLNFILFINPFFKSWSFYVLMQMILGGVFMYFYLLKIRVTRSSAILGVFTYVFSGFFIAWLEWGNILHTVLWLPLILFSVHKIYEVKNKKQEIIWLLSLTFCLCSSFFAGHLQSFFYLFIVFILYTFGLIIVRRYKLKKSLPIFTSVFLFLTITSIQWVPTLQFIEFSARNLDLSYKSEGWFIPYQNLLQFIAPDFFGNPSTLNYFGIWNYAEFIGYASIISIMMVIYAIVFRRDKKTLFFFLLLIIVLLSSTNNFISILPFKFSLPFISTSQPTRLLGIACFCIAVLTSLGFDCLQRYKKNVFLPIIFIGFILLLMWVFVLFIPHIFGSLNNNYVARNNLKLPTLLFILYSLLLIIYLKIKNPNYRNIVIFMITFIVLIDLMRFAWKFTPFTDKEYLFPRTKTIEFLEKNIGDFRIATTDSRILPPNFSTYYKIYSIEGYDPLYSFNYAKLVASNERENHSITPPFGFNRIITPRNINTQTINLLNVKYILSLDNLDKPNFKKVFQEGNLKVYKNMNVFPKAFFVKRLIGKNSEEKAAETLYNINLKDEAVTVSKKNLEEYNPGLVKILSYTPNKIVIETYNDKDGFLVLTDSFYPSFRAKIDGEDTEIIQVNLALRGVRVPEGKHKIIFYSTLF